MDRRKVLSAAASLLGAVAAFMAAIPFVGSLMPSAKARAFAEPVEVDLSSLRPGEVKAFTYRGRTMLALRRTAAMLDTLSEMDERVIDTSVEDASIENDPSYVADRLRSIAPDFLIVEGVCTHLGCVPRLVNAERGQAAMGDWWRGGFVCPCHSSGFDFAGRVIRGPAPRNLPVPPHRYLSPTRIVVGEDTVSS